ncbi:MAG: RNA-binding protein [Candidatus Thermoplasmatota archaeon]|nr:RNA-binding protein [Candidatus Thermoplasmatota archaeon]
MSNHIYVGNLPWSFRDESLKELFEEHGEVTSAKVIVDRMSGRSRGFGFVEMASADEAGAAIEALNGHEADGRELKVNEAKPRDG